MPDAFAGFTGGRRRRVTLRIEGSLPRATHRRGPAPQAALHVEEVAALAYAAAAEARSREERALALRFAATSASTRRVR